MRITDTFVELTDQRGFKQVVNSRCIIRIYCIEDEASSAIIEIQRATEVATIELRESYADFLLRAFFTENT